MKVEVLFTGKDCSSDIVKGKNAIVIDVLRATSVITTALASGAKSVKTFMNVEEIWSFLKDRNRDDYILGGEREALKIEGFDFGNSPLEYTKENVANKNILISTTNGTKAIHNAVAADMLYLMSFLNLDAVKSRILKDEKDVVIVCAGTNDKFTIDDSYCAAGLVAELFKANSKIKFDDAGKMLINYYNLNVKDIEKTISQSKHYQVLVKTGFKKDIDFCVKRDIFKIVPYQDKGQFYCNASE